MYLLYCHGSADCKATVQYMYMYMCVSKDRICTPEDASIGTERLLYGVCQVHFICRPATNMIFVRVRRLSVRPYLGVTGCKYIYEQVGTYLGIQYGV